MVKNHKEQTSMSEQPSEKEIISKYFSEMAKKTHQKHPRSKEFYRDMQKKSIAKQKQKLLEGLNVKLS